MVVEAGTTPSILMRPAAPGWFSKVNASGWWGRLKRPSLTSPKTTILASPGLCPRFFNVSRMSLRVTLFSETNVMFAMPRSPSKRADSTPRSFFNRGSTERAQDSQSNPETRISTERNCATHGATHSVRLIANRRQTFPRGFTVSHHNTKE